MRGKKMEEKKIFDLGEYQFERTVWANMQLSKLCPGGNISNFTKLLEDEDTSKQLNSMIDIALILNEAAERKASFLDPNHEKHLLPRDLLLCLDEETLSNITLTALGVYQKDGEITVDAEPKKEEVEEIESESTTAGSSTSAIN
jgi:hypothetical protein